VKHAFYPVAVAQKFDLLKAMLDRTEYHSVIIFCRTKDGADRIARQLENEKHKVAVMHSNRSQQERVDALEGFKTGRYEVMIATDIAARGIDVDEVSHVVNYELPHEPETYVHRIGRTGRAGLTGEAVSFCDREEEDRLEAIERLLRRRIPVRNDLPADLPKVESSSSGRDSGERSGGGGRGRGRPGQRRSSEGSGRSGRSGGGRATGERSGGSRSAGSRRASGRRSNGGAGEPAAPAYREVSGGESAQTPPRPAPQGGPSKVNRRYRRAL
jgi:ATP-dependent RNA helicase RhlE